MISLSLSLAGLIHDGHGSGSMKASRLKHETTLPAENHTEIKKKKKRERKKTRKIWRKGRRGGGRKGRKMRVVTHGGRRVTTRVHA